MTDPSSRPSPRLPSPGRSTARQPLARRPLGSRAYAWPNALARCLTGAGLTPNQVSLASVGFAALGAACLIAAGWWSGSGGGAPVWLLLALPWIGLRMLANLLDGLMAVEGGQRSRLGELYNEVPDRFADALLLVSAGYAVAPAPLGGSLGWLAALLALLAAYVRAFGASLTGHQDYCGPGAKPHRMYLLVAGCFGAGLAGMLGVSFWTWLLPAALTVICLATALTVARRLHRLALRLSAREPAP